LKSIAAKTTMLALLVMLPSLAGAQTHRGSVRGTVTDANGAVVPGANVEVVNSETNESRTTITDEEGSYAVSSLPPGP